MLEEGEKGEDEERQQAMEAGSREDGQVRIVERRRKLALLFFFFPVFINSIAPEPSRSWAGDSCGGRGGKISKMADKQGGREGSHVVIDESVAMLGKKRVNS